MCRVNVKEAYDRVYRMAGWKPSSNASNDPNSKANIETVARKRALAHLEGPDRRQVESCVKRLKECCVGVMLGDSAALQILEHLGVFLMQAERV